MKRRTGLAIFLLIFLPLATSCTSIRGELVETGFGTPSDRTTASASNPVSSPPTATLASEVSAPIELADNDASESFDFTSKELYSGSTVEGAELFGQGSVLVTFVQPGCELSIGDGSTIAEVAEQTPGVTYVIVHSGADDDAYVAFAQEAELYQENMVHLSDHFGALSTRYGVTEFPTTLLIDADLRISGVTGALNAAAQQQAIQLITAPAS